MAVVSFPWNYLHLKVSMQVFEKYVFVNKFKFQ